MRHGSLFTGIGGFDLAAQWMGWENVFQVEWDGFCQKVLSKNFPNVKRYGDIREFNGTEYRGRVDIISGGFPCQPFSHAGKRKGTADDRYLWPEMLRVIGEVKPAFVVGENVAGLVSMENGKTLDRILSDLADEGYQTEQFIIPACGVGAWHRRERIWIIARRNRVFQDSNIGRRIGKERIGENDLRGGKIKEQDNNTNETGKGHTIISNTSAKGLPECRCEPEQQKISQRFRTEYKGENVPDSKKQRIQGVGRVRKQGTKEDAGQGLSLCSCNGNRTNLDWWSVEPSVGRVANGIPNRVDRLKGLGNAIVPQIAYEIFKAIECLAPGR